jgi:uncharacterized membrane protein YkoI
LRNVQELINNFMEERIVIGFIVGLVASTAFWVWSSDFFTKAQKIIILISLIFPPGALFVIILISIYNKTTKPTVSDDANAEYSPKKDLSTLNDSLTKVKELHSKGVFNDSELHQKISEIEKQIRARERDKVLQNVESKVKLSEEYNALKILRSSQIIDNEEFNKKVQQLIDNELVSLPLSKENEEPKAKLASNSNNAIIILGIYAFLLISFIVLSAWFR